MLRQLYELIGPRTQAYWVHWNMRSVVYGFEHVAHRYRALTGGTIAPIIPVEHRINLNDVLREKYGDLYVAHPQLINLMRMQGDLPKDFLTGEQESACFSHREFIRMHQSTISKAQFLRHAIELLLKGRLKTNAIGIANRIDRLLSSQWARVLSFFTSVLGLGSWLAYVAVKIYSVVH